MSSVTEITCLVPEKRACRLWDLRLLGSIALRNKVAELSAVLQCGNADDILGAMEALRIQGVRGAAGVLAALQAYSRRTDSCYACF